MHGLVAAATAAYDTHFTLARSVFAYDDAVIIIDAYEVSMGYFHTLERLFDYVVYIVDELFHLSYLLWEF